MTYGKPVPCLCDLNYVDRTCQRAILHLYPAYMTFSNRTNVMFITYGNKTYPVYVTYDDRTYVPFINPLDAGRRLTDFSQTSYAAGSRLTYCTVNQRSGSVG